MGLNVLAGTGDGDAVEQLEEFEVEGLEDGIRRAFFGRQLAPTGEGSLGLAENFLDTVAGVELGAEFFGFAFVGEGELVFEIGEAVVHRRGGKHQDLGLHAGADDLVHEPFVTRFPHFLAGRVVAEVVGFVDDDEVEVAPVDLFEIGAVGMAAGALEVGVVEDGVVEAVCGEDVGFERTVISEPVVREFLGAEDEHGFVPQLVVFDDGEGSEGFAEAHAVGEDAAVEGFELVDDADGGIALEVEELFPDDRFLIAGAVVGQDVLGDVFEELGEDVVEHHEVDAFRRILGVDVGNVLADLAGDVLEFFPVAPNLLEQAQVAVGHGSSGELVDDVGKRAALLIAEIDGGESLERKIDVGLAVGGLDAGHLLHQGLGGVRAEGDLAPDPVRAFAGDGALGEHVAKLDFELGAVEAAFAFELGDEELALFLRQLVGRLALHEGGRGEDEFDGFHLLQLRLERLERVDRKARSGDLELRAGGDGAFHVSTVAAQQWTGRFETFKTKQYLQNCQRR